jgi:hypothetical protein
MSTIKGFACLSRPLFDTRMYRSVNCGSVVLSSAKCPHGCHQGKYIYRLASVQSNLEPELGEDCGKNEEISTRSPNMNPSLSTRTPPVGTSGVSLLQVLLDGLLGVLSLSGLLEGLGGNGSLQAFELECVSSGKQVGVVDDLDERLDLGSLGDSLGTHRLVDLQGVPIAVHPTASSATYVLSTGLSSAYDTDFSIPATMA